MPFEVLLTHDAERDLEELYSHIARHDSPKNADRVLDRIVKVYSQLSELADCGTYPKELSAVGIREYREIFFKPYRIVYRVMDEKVYVLLMTDGRRDRFTLLQRRLLNT